MKSSVMKNRSIDQKRDEARANRDFATSDEIKRYFERSKVSF